LGGAKEFLGDCSSHGGNKSLQDLARDNSWTSIKSLLGPEAFLMRTNASIPMNLIFRGSRPISMMNEVLIKSCFFYAYLAETEFLEDFHQALRARPAYRYKEINISHVSRKSMKADRVAFNDKLLNGIFFQQRNEVEKVGIQVFHRRGFGKSLPWRKGVPGELISTRDFHARAGFPECAW
jgi:hypothetical protein